MLLDHISGHIVAAFVGAHNSGADHVRKAMTDMYRWQCQHIAGAIASRMTEIYR